MFHEYTHGINGCLTSSQYMNEAGAVMEAYADTGNQVSMGGDINGKLSTSLLSETEYMMLIDIGVKGLGNIGIVQVNDFYSAHDVKVIIKKTIDAKVGDTFENPDTYFITTRPAGEEIGDIVYMYIVDVQ